MQNKLRDQLRLDLFTAMKHGDDLKKHLLQFLLGEIQLKESRTGVYLQDTEICTVINKTIDNNKASIDILKKIESNKANKIYELNRENEILNSYLPAYATIEEITTALKPMINDFNSDSLKEWLLKATVILNDKAINYKKSDLVKVISEFRKNMAITK